MLKGAIFDMDGVLIDSHPAHKQAWRMFLQEIGRPCSDDDLEYVLDGRTRRDILCHFLGAITDEEFQTYSKLKDKHFAIYSDKVRLIPGVAQFLDALTSAGVDCAVATSASRSRACQMLDRFRLHRYFSALVAGTDVQHGKPDPAIFRLASVRLGHEPESVIAFDDAVSGVQSATGAGLTCVGIGSGSHAQALLAAGAASTLPDFLGVSISELVRLLPHPAVETC